MELHKLYKGRYLIALYDKNDMLVDVGINPFDLLTCSIRPIPFMKMFLGVGIAYLDILYT